MSASGKTNRENFAELELLLAIRDDKGVLLEYIKNKPAIAQAFIEKESLEIQKRLYIIQNVSLHLAKVVSDIE